VWSGDEEDAMPGLSALIALAIALFAVLFVYLGAGTLLGTRWGRRTLLLAGVVVPLAASAGSFKAGLHESSQTRFCLSCHEMQSYGKSLFVDNRQALPAVHFQNRLVDRDSACYSCHADYAMFGDVKAKLNGLRHVYVHYLAKPPEKMALYQPYPNHNCLHCHEDARKYIEAPAHRAVSAALSSGTQSCLGCHAIAHDMLSVNAHKFWQAE
jgi:cytochrome c-type protein NapC